MKSDAQFLRHILDEIDFAISETRVLAFDDFVKNETLKRACTRSLEIIGKAAKIVLTVLKESNTSGRAGGLKYVNRSKRIENTEPPKGGYSSNILS